MTHSHSILNPEPLPQTPDLERVVCDYCGQQQADVLAVLPPPDELPLPMHRLGAAALHLNGETIRFVRCRSCGLVYMNPRLAEAAITRFYDTVYGQKGGSTEFEREQPVRLSYLMETTARLLNGREPASLFDIGCGAGQFLQLAQARGWTVTGSEISHVAAERASQRLGVPVYTGDFRDLPFAPQSFDVVSLLQVVEHVREPVNFLRDSAALVKPGGLLLVGVPNVDALEYDVSAALRLYYRGFIIEHLYYFTPAFMRRLLADLGLEIVKLSSWLPHSHYPNPLADIRALLRPPAAPAASAAPPTVGIPPLKPVTLPRRVLRQMNNYLMDYVSKFSEGGPDSQQARGNTMLVWAQRR